MVYYALKFGKYVVCFSLGLLLLKTKKSMTFK